MSQHTKGPWRVDETKALGAYGVWTDYATHPGHDNAGYPSQICAMPLSDELIDREQRDANARLIAAAPDLLAALIDLVERAETVNESSGEYGPDFFSPGLLAKSRAAVAKAEGGVT